MEKFLQSAGRQAAPEFFCAGSYLFRPKICYNSKIEFCQTGRRKAFARPKEVS